MRTSIRVNARKILKYRDKYVFYFLNFGEF